MAVRLCGRKARCDQMNSETARAQLRYCAFFKTYSAALQFESDMLSQEDASLPRHAYMRKHGIGSGSAEYYAWLLKEAEIAKETSR